MALCGLRSIDHLVVATTDVEGSVAWYTDVLGFVKDWEEILDDPGFEALIGIPGARTHCVGGHVNGTRIEFNHTSWNPTTPRGGGTGLSIFTSAVEDADQAYAEAKARGLTFAYGGEVQVAAGCKIFFVEAPDKQTIEFVEYTDDSESPWNTYG